MAAPADEAKSLMAQGKYADALQKLDQQLAKNPQDAESRFARGIALTKLNRTPEAMKVFTDLTRDYPQLPEPYNNLAVLYAQQGDYEKARDALEAALATHPSYATAHENLGDIYAALAGAAYNRALMLDQGNQTVRNKLNLIGQLEKPVNDVLAVKGGSKPAAAPAAAPAATEAPAEPVDADTAAAIANALTAWSKAWSAKDVATYLSAYGDDFTPEAGQSRAAWAQQRRERISKPAHIQVDVQNVQTARTAPDRVRASFLQVYESDSFSDSVNKVLDFKLVNGAWKIVREYTR
ncbi:MAG: tetratricopeptide repeat protein [Nevskiaceae bacterium]|nr:MAG: tetratricopeptide repeat protein [Nevskiaceae bacterium]